MMALKSILLLVIWIFAGFVNESHVVPANALELPRASLNACFVDVDPEPPPYYKIDLVTTRRVPGAGEAHGIGELSYKTTPFGIAIGPDGSYLYDLSLKIQRLQPARSGHYVAWISTPDLSEIKRLGPLDELFRIQGQVDWNKFLVVISLEKDLQAEQPKWKGPIVLRGLSRSGLMHTMAGHGPYQNEPCAIYGY